MKAAVVPLPLLRVPDEVISTVPVNVASTVELPSTAEILTLKSTPAVWVKILPVLSFSIRNVTNCPGLDTTKELLTDEVRPVLDAVRANVSAASRIRSLKDIWPLASVLNVVVPVKLPVPVEMAIVTEVPGVSMVLPPTSWISTLIVGDKTSFIVPADGDCV